VAPMVRRVPGRRRPGDRRHPSDVGHDPISNLAVALILTEAYQRTDNEKAIELLESLGAEAPEEPVFARP
jgi:hypothetical protein